MLTASRVKTNSTFALTKQTALHSGIQTVAPFTAIGLPHGLLGLLDPDCMKSSQETTREEEATLCPSDAPLHIAWDPLPHTIHKHAMKMPPSQPVQEGG